MEHVVFYPSAQGESAFKRVNSLDEAVSFVEHLRNSENITEFEVHSLSLVPLSFRAYYHVEVPAGAEPVAAAEPVTEPFPEPVAEPAELAEPVAEEAAEPVVAEAPAVESEVADVLEAAAPEAEVAETPESAVEVPEQAAAAESPVESAPDTEVTMAPVEAVDEDRSEEWVAEASVVEPAAELPVEAPAAPAAEEPVVASGPFADAPPVTPSGTEDVVPVPTGKRSMGFFAR